ncbi:YdeI family protein [Persicitalea sp.]|uniref:YdeI/OmpD-associated family protein n=1 Tax=Persicitalea sp. TaxID=3100273 RepID=UPI00359461F1
MEKRKDGVGTFFARSAAEWRAWLAENHATAQSVWLIIYKKASDIPSVYYPEAVDEALCFGWIDSKGNKRNAESYFQFFSKRNPKSNWSGVNKRKIKKLLKENRMAHAGLEMVEIAKKSGTWDALNDVENGIVPEDLMNAFEKYPQAAKHFDAFPKSVKRGILEWIFNAKRPATRQKRIEETAALAAENNRAAQWKKDKE